MAHYGSGHPGVGRALPTCSPTKQNGGFRQIPFGTSIVGLDGTNAVLDLNGGSMNAALVLTGIGIATIVIPKVVGAANRKWFSNIEAMDEDYPRRDTGPTWGAGGGHLGL